MKIQKSLLEDAITELHFMMQRGFSASQRRFIDWRVINERLEMLDRALTSDDKSSFKENYYFLLKRLSHKNEARREYGPEPEDPKQLPPDTTRELFNHVVDKIILRLEEVEEEQRSHDSKENL